MIEQLTDEERADLVYANGYGPGDGIKALRIIDAQSERIAELTDMATVNFDAMVEMRDTRDAANDRAEELEEKLSVMVDVFASCDQSTPAERKVLEALKQALSRLGDDPPYYEIYDSPCGEPFNLFELNPDLPQVLNAWTSELALRAEKDIPL
jgi:hypothetical protein